MNFIYELIGVPLGYLMSLIYNIVPNYAIAIIIFTLVTKLLLFPMNYKTQKNAARMQLLQPKLQKLQKSFSNNPARLQEEQQKLYQEEGLNPMGSCLPAFIQMFLLFGVIDVVYKPIKHILRLSKDVRMAAVEKASELAMQFKDVNGGKAIESNNIRHELLTMEVFDKHTAEFNNIGESFSALVSEFSENFTIFGANLGKTPTLHPEVWDKEAIILCAIPFLAGISQLLVSFYSMIHQKKTNPTPQAGGGCMNVMMLLMPIMSIWIAFEVPAGIGFYWIWSSLFSFLVTLGLNCYFTHDRVVAMNERDKEKARIYAEKHPEKKTFMQKMLEQQAALEAQNGGSTVNSGEKKSRSEQNKANRDAINDARRRMAEKYGDLYEDSKDSEN